MSSLLDVPSEDASDSALSISTETSPSASCEFSRLAKDEVSLRKALLVWLCSTAANYEVGDRLNDWEALISAEKSKLNQIEDEWRKTLSLNS